MRGAGDDSHCAPDRYASPAAGVAVRLVVAPLLTQTQSSLPTRVRALGRGKRAVSVGDRQRFRCVGRPLLAAHVLGGDTRELCLAHGRAACIPRAAGCCWAHRLGGPPAHATGGPGSGAARWQAMGRWWCGGRSGVARCKDRRIDRPTHAGDLSGGETGTALVPARAIRQDQGPWEERGSCCACRPGRYILVLSRRLRPDVPSETTST